MLQLRGIVPSEAKALLEALQGGGEYRASDNTIVRDGTNNRRLSERLNVEEPAREYAEMKAFLATPTGWSVGADGLIAWRDFSRDQVNATHTLGSLPLCFM